MCHGSGSVEAHPGQAFFAALAHSKRSRCASVDSETRSDPFRWGTLRQIARGFLDTFLLLDSILTVRKRVCDKRGKQLWAPTRQQVHVACICSPTLRHHSTQCLVAWICLREGQRGRGNKHRSKHLTLLHFTILLYGVGDRRETAMIHEKASCQQHALAYDSLIPIIDK